MLYLENDKTDPHYNLAFEEYVFTTVAPGESILLLWQNEPSVIIGRYQNTIEEVNSDFIEANGIHVVRRMTGGGAVYHDLGNLNYSLIVPAGDLNLDFKTLTAPLVETLKALGIQAEQTGRNDVTLDGKKFSGNAQHYAKGRLLHHGTILFDSNLDRVNEALRVKPAKIDSKSIKSVRSRVTNIRPHLQEPLTLDEFRNLFLDHFRKAQNLTVFRLSPSDLNAVQRLAEEKYRSWDWNYGRSPACSLVKSGRYSCGCVDFHLQIKEHKIQSMHVFGDFFCSEDLALFTGAFLGIPFTRKAVGEVLERINVAKYFQNIKDEEILDTLF